MMKEAKKIQVSDREGQRLSVKTNVALNCSVVTCVCFSKIKINENFQVNGKKLKLKSSRSENEREFEREEQMVRS